MAPEMLLKFASLSTAPSTYTVSSNEVSYYPMIDGEKRLRYGTVGLAAWVTPPEPRSIVLSRVQ